MRARQDIWEQGWTAEALRAATGALVDAVAMNQPRAGLEGREIAAELIRWLQYALNANTDQFVQQIQLCRPLTQNSPHWDELDAILERVCPLDELAALLAERYLDPVATLIALLNEVAPPGVVWGEGVQDPAICAHRRAFEALIVFATAESLTFVLTHLDLFDWDAADTLEDDIAPRCAAIKTVAFQLWPTLTWKVRAKVVRLVERYAGIDERIFDLLLSVDASAMNSDDKRGYLEALGNCFQERVLPQIDAMLDQALAELVAGVPGAQATVRIAVRQYAKLDAEPTAAQRDLAEAHGVRWEARPHWYDGM